MSPTHMAIQAAVFLITLSGLMFEIGLTRIFSATIWYHFAFVAISVALLGWGLGGFALHALRKRLTPSLEKAAVLTLLYAASMPVSLFSIVRFPFSPDKLAFYFVASCLPFLLAGSALSMVFALRRRDAARLYFADLLGASLGAVAVTFLLSWLGAEQAVLAVSLCPAIAAALLSPRLRMPAAVVAVLLLAAVVTQDQWRVFSIRSAPTKGMYRHLAAHPEAKIALTGWNAYSRIDAVTGHANELARLYIDSDAWTGMHRWDGNVESIRSLSTWFRARPFAFTPQAKTLVIGPGGGSDLLVALGSGSQSVTAVEMNPLMLRFVRHFGAEAGNLYDHPRIETVLSEGRNYLSRTDRSFDVIFLGFVDSWAAVASGGLSLSENYLYTTEAFRAYYDHLTPDGALTIMRWREDVPRLVSNAVALLGAEEARKRVVVVMEKRANGDDPPQMIFMLRKSPFTEAQATTIMDTWTDATPVIVPGRVAEGAYGDLLSGRKTMDQYVDDMPVRAGPVFDDRPFFFARQKPYGLPRTMMTAFVEVLVPLVVLCAVLLAFGRPQGPGAGPYGASLAYFASLGVGFIVMELALLQHMTLLLGHPIFTLSVLLFTLLAAGGLGSSFSERFRTPVVCGVIAALGVVYALALPKLVPALLPLSLAARIAIAIAIVAPLGFAMGMPFPSGLRRVGGGSLPEPPFYWGLNGVMSVVGSIGTMLIAVTLGFQVAMLVGAACYVCAALAGRRLAEAAALPLEVQSPAA
jgi:predicted membrane-bound spermidine synthase